MPKGSSVIPEMEVSRTTENAPSCKVITQPRIDASAIFSRLAALALILENQRLRMIGR